MDAIVKSFETFIKRSLLPSSSFLLFLILYDYFLNDEELLDLLRCVNSMMMIVVVFMLFIGLSTILSIIHQAIYDNFLKENFDGLCKKYPDNLFLKILRKDVQEALDYPDSTDYMLYHKIRTTLEKDDIDASRYVDGTKAIGITFVSMMIMLIVTICTHKSILCFIALFPIYFIGRELIKSKYRSRAIFIYSIYLNKQ